MSAEGQSDITICSPDCPTRLRIRSNRLPITRLVNACEAAAGILVYEGTRIEGCPLQQFTEHVLDTLE